MDALSLFPWKRKATEEDADFVRLPGEDASSRTEPFQLQEVLAAELNEIRDRRSHYVETSAAADSSQKSDEKPEARSRPVLPFPPQKPLANVFRDVVLDLEAKSDRWAIPAWHTRRAIVRWLNADDSDTAAPDGASESLRIRKADLDRLRFDATILDGGALQIVPREDKRDGRNGDRSRPVSDFIEILSCVQYQNRREAPDRNPRRFLISIGRAGGMEVKLSIPKPPQAEEAASDGIVVPLINPEKLLSRMTRRENLIGLALSGGGVRSATFNLGIVQGLRRLGLFDCIDYMSTVSGGGYIGSSISALYSSHQEFPYEHQQGAPEPAPFRHLRNHAKYLSPQGLQDLFRVPALFFRGILINFAIILPWLLMAAIVTALLWPAPLAPTEETDLGSRLAWSKIIFWSFFAILLLYPVVRRLRVLISDGTPPSWESRDRWGRFLGICIGALGVVGFIEAQPIALEFFQRTLKLPLYELNLSPDLVTSVGAVTSFLLSLLSVKFAKTVSGVAGKVGLFLLGALGVLAFWLVYLDFSRWVIWDEPPDWLREVSVSWFNDMFQQLSPADMIPPNLDLLSTYLVVAVILFLYGLIFVDVNETTLHNYYRDRLSKAYLICYNDGHEIVPCDNLRLSGLGGKVGPYHLINAALNVRQQQQAYRTARHADFFFFGKRFTGGSLTGYCPTEMIENVDPHLNLGTAMAISGAAASPNMGKITIRPLVFIMGMLNVRLNYWLPNPRVVATKAVVGRYYRPGPGYFLMELAGWLDAKSWRVNLSDGGHVENTGIFELLRRECRLIIAGDGECDPNLTFNGLAELVRLAQIDLGIEIDMDGLDEIRHGRQHHAIGTIRYRNNRYGKLLYLKASLLGDDMLNATLKDDAYVSSALRVDDRGYDVNPYIAHYKSRNPSFPHESTADQFFTEEQFECYRALGFEVATRTLDPKHSGRPVSRSPTTTKVAELRGLAMGLPIETPGNDD